MNPNVARRQVEAGHPSGVDRQICTRLVIQNHQTEPTETLHNRTTPPSQTRRHRRSRLTAKPIAASLLLAGLCVFGISQSPAAGQTSNGDCGEMADSIKRLYQAYYVRDPDTEGLTYWMNEYRSGRANLAKISQEFAESPEFIQRYGTRTNEQFVSLAYRNVLRRSPDPKGLDHWVSVLDQGYPRGSLMIAFSESKEFVAHTQTAIPMAGYLRWYPEGVRWYCGRGPAERLAVQPLIGNRLRADYLFKNRSATAVEPFSIHTVENNVRNVQMSAGSMTPGMTDYRWDGAFSGDGSYGTHLDIEAGSDSSWIIVFYDGSIGQERLGWQIDS